jgi:hypothetical protein
MSKELDNLDDVAAQLSWGVNHRTAKHSAFLLKRMARKRPVTRIGRLQAVAKKAKVTLPEKA